jgi:4-hydroxy-tetrahydrodipicolinate synthase
VAVKEASGNIEQIMEIIHKAPDHFSVISGDDGITLPLISVGCKGVISVVANSYPQDFSNMVRFVLNQELARARDIHYRLIPFMHLIFAEGSPAGIKSALYHQGIIQNELRSPLVPASEKLSNEIKSFLENY